MAALKLYRSSGEQNVTVQNVSVQDRGQAIVTQHPPKSSPDQAATQPPAITDARMEPMAILEERRPERVRSERQSKP
jgi:hypothetical protein